jgi:hypothetical protein
VESPADDSLPTLPANELDYARGAVVGAVVVDRRANADETTAVVITIQRFTPMFRGGIVVACTGAITLTLALAVRFGPAIPWRFVEGSWILLALLGFGFMISGAIGTMNALRPRTIEVAGGAMSILLRRERDVVRAEFPAGTVADVSLAPLPLRFVAIMRDAQLAQAVLITGDRVDLHFGTRQETQFIRQILTTELSLPSKPWVDVDLPRTRWPSRLKVRIDPFGVRVQQPARATWFLLTLTTILMLAMPFMVAWMRTLSGRSWQRVWERDTSPLLSGVGTLLLGLAICSIVYHFRRSTSIALDPRLLVISESHPIRPALIELSTSQIRAFALQQQRRGGCVIDAELIDGSSQVVLQRLRKRDAKVAFELMTVGLHRAKRHVTNASHATLS